MTTLYRTVAVPTLFITKNKQRVKQYSQNVYLQNGDEFELELFNPTQNKLLAKIYLNEQTLGSGLILRPGERVFLERYFDMPVRFKFDTYKVDMNDSDVREAVKNNGKVRVEFYEERLCNNITISTLGNNWYSYTFGNTVSPTITIPSTTCMYSSTSGASNVNTRSSNTLSFMDTQETGRIEQGSASNQSFVSDNTSFNSYYTWISNWQILPESTKPMTSSDISVYCPQCGMKRKKSSYNFCPGCGHKF